MRKGYSSKSHRHKFSHPPVFISVNVVVILLTYFFEFYELILFVSDNFRYESLNSILVLLRTLFLIYSSYSQLRWRQGFLLLDKGVPCFQDPKHPALVEPLYALIASHLLHHRVLDSSIFYWAKKSLPVMARLEC